MNTKSLRMRYENFQYWTRHNFYPYLYRWSVVVIAALLLVSLAFGGAR